MMNLCQCLQNNVVNSKLTYLIYSSLEALLNINVIATLEDLCNGQHTSSTTAYNKRTPAASIGLAAGILPLNGDYLR